MTDLKMHAAFDTATLGALIDALARADADADVMFDFCYLAPTTLASYRGFYDHLAIGWTVEHGPEGYWPKAGTLLAALRDALGKEFGGYKGGRYRMDAGTPVWVDNVGEASSTAIVGIEIDGPSVVLHTKRVGW